MPATCTLGVCRFAAVVLATAVGAAEAPKSSITNVAKSSPPTSSATSR